MEQLNAFASKVCPWGPRDQKMLRCVVILRLMPSQAGQTLFQDRHEQSGFLEGHLCKSYKIREKQRGVENSGEGKTYHEPPHQKQF